LDKSNVRGRFCFFKIIKNFPNTNIFLLWGVKKKKIRGGGGGSKTVKCPFQITTMVLLS